MVCKENLDGPNITPQTHEFDFSTLLAFIVFIYWLKCILLLKASRTFGPMIKIVQLMMIDLVQFLALWGLIMAIFTSVSTLMFGDRNHWETSMITVKGTEVTRQSLSLVNFSDFQDVFIFYLQSALGSWSMTNIQEARIGTFASFYHYLYLTINLILLLNYVIAILSSVFANYEDKQLGLYYEVMIKLFGVMRYDEEYGYIACSTMPMNIVTHSLFPFSLCNQKTREKRVKFNDIMCNIIYFPYTLIITFGFMAANLVLIPLAWLSQLLRLISSVKYLKLNEIPRRLVTITLHIFMSIPFLILSLFFDTMFFYKHLYS